MIKASTFCDRLNMTGSLQWFEANEILNGKFIRSTAHSVYVGRFRLGQVVSECHEAKRKTKYFSYLRETRINYLGVGEA